MKKVLFILIVVIAVLAAWCAGAYRNLRNAEDDVMAAWSQFSGNCMRRIDLIPSLTASVKSYPQFDSTSFDALARARDAAVMYELPDYSQESVDGFRAVQDRLESELKAFTLLTSACEELKEDEAYMDFSSMLADSFAKISDSARLYDMAVDNYDEVAGTFPATILVKILKSEPRGRLGY